MREIEIFKAFVLVALSFFNENRAYLFRSRGYALNASPRGNADAHLTRSASPAAASTARTRAKADAPCFAETPSKEKAPTTARRRFLF